jgi:small subunit ribosomal protein S19
MALKEQTYRGKSIDELKTMSVREFANLVPSRERRTILRNFQEIEDFIARCKKKLAKKPIAKTHKRHIVIVPEMIDMNIGVYNGKSFEKVTITYEMLGHRLGEFAMTRSKVKHGAAGVGATRGSASKSVK